MQGNYARAGSIILMVVSGLGVANSEGNSPAIKTLSKLGLGVGIALNAAAWTNMLGTAAAITF
jgi:VIT1/CCC1 family predicted Fe2+/Mn2+ transporter